MGASVDGRGEHMKRRIVATLAASLVLASSLAACGSTSAGTATTDAGADATVEAAADEAEDIQYVLYLGTNDKDTNEPVFDREESKERAKQILISRLGGYTISEAEGGWIGDDGKIYQEYTMIIYLSDTSLDEVHAVCDDLIEAFNQSSVLIQSNKTTTEFYSGAD